MSRPRYPSQVYERFSKQRTKKQRIHELLRHTPTLTTDQIAQAVSCPTSFARLWSRRFFAPGYRPQAQAEPS